MLNLVRPSMALQKSFLAGLKEFQKEGLPWHLEVDYDATEAHFDRFVKEKCDKVGLRTDKLVPETELWAEMQGEFVGRISIRHELNDALRITGGNIGYDTRPTYRGRGIASEMLRLAVPVARQLGLSRVLLTCDDSNAASIRVIEKNAGILEKKVLIDPARPLKRYYWIEL